jgi:hypothetical protein
MRAIRIEKISSHKIKLEKALSLTIKMNTLKFE